MSWIHVPNWGRFQHYGAVRRPIWVKNYVALLHKEEYTDLSLAERGLLHGIWLAYADTQGRVRTDRLHSIVTASTRKRHLESLSHAGFIEVSASRRTSAEVEEEELRSSSTTPAETLRRRAENWIRNGAASEIPQSDLAHTFEDNFHITDPDALASLVAQALEWR
jgi:hypothetical protein